MRSNGVAMKDQMIEYGTLAWSRIVGSRNPLDVILDKGLDVFIKVDQTKYYARFIEIKAPATTVSNGGRKEVLTRQRAGSSPSGGILLLRLSESQVDEIRATGVCTIDAFTNGGLTRPYRRKLQLGKPTVKGEAGDGAAEALFTPVDFVRCELFEHGRVTEAVRSGGTDEVSTESDLVPVRLEVRRYNLFLRKADVVVLRREGISDWQEVPYPFEETGVPSPIYWAYQASIALNRDRVPMPEGVVGWLRDNAPKEAYAIRGIKTLASMVRLDYRNKGNFDRVSLADFPKAEQLPEEHISKPIRLLMDVSDWWSVHWGWNGSDKARLWQRLVEAGFDKTAVRSFYGLIEVHPVTEAGLQELDWYLEEGRAAL